MPPVVIENPILNPPYREPTRHFRDENGQIINAIDPGRRGSSYFLPIPAPKKKGAPGLFDNDYAGETKAENRVCTDLGKHREIMVINDEAHRCYRGKPSFARSSKTWTKCGLTRRTRASASASRTPATGGPGTTTRTSS